MIINPEKVLSKKGIGWIDWNTGTIHMSNTLAVDKFKLALDGWKVKHGD